MLVSRLRLMDIFAGCGGMTRGFFDSGAFEPVFAVERYFSAAETYALNFGEHVHIGPIEEVESFPARLDVFIGGPPCQGFSPLNMRGAGLERRSLWRDYLRALVDADPRAFVMENVPELLRSPDYVDSAGRPKNSGIPWRRAFSTPPISVFLDQRRRRASAIGVGAPFPLAGATHSSPSKMHSRCRPGAHSRMRSTVFRCSRTVDLASHPQPAAAQPSKRYRTIPNEGEGRFELAARRPDITPPCWLRKTSGSTDVFGRLWWNRPAFTIRTEFYKPEKGATCTPSRTAPSRCVRPPVA